MWNCSKRGPTRPSRLLHPAGAQPLLPGLRARHVLQQREAPHVFRPRDGRPAGEERRRGHRHDDLPHQPVADRPRPYLAPEVDRGVDVAPGEVERPHLGHEVELDVGVPGREVAEPGDSHRDPKVGSRATVSTPPPPP